MKARVLRLMSAVMTPWILAACHDSTAPIPLVWSTVSSGTTNSLYSVWGTSASDVWAVGFGTILHYNGTSWSSAWSGTTQHLLGVWGASASDVWAVGWETTNLGPVMLHYNGTSWSSVSSGTTQLLGDVWGSSPSDVWAVGNSGTIFHGSPSG
jgi:hypothetical protein